jgi:hypothetical protein
VAEDLVQGHRCLADVALIAPAQRMNRSSCGILFAGSPAVPLTKFQPLLAIVGRIILLSKRKLNLDFGMLVAVERFTTGANAHNLRGLANAYVLACETDQPSMAEKYRTRLLRELNRSVRGNRNSLNCC